MVLETTDTLDAGPVAAIGVGTRAFPGLLARLLTPAGAPLAATAITAHACLSGAGAGGGTPRPTDGEGSARPVQHAPAEAQAHHDQSRAPPGRAECA